VKSISVLRFIFDNLLFFQRDLILICPDVGSQSLRTYVALEVCGGIVYRITLVDAGRIGRQVEIPADRINQQWISRDIMHSRDNARVIPASVVPHIVVVQQGCSIVNIDTTPLNVSYIIHHNVATDDWAARPDIQSSTITTGRIGSEGVILDRRISRAVAQSTTIDSCVACEGVILNRESTSVAKKPTPITRRVASEGIVIYREITGTVIKSTTFTCFASPGCIVDVCIILDDGISCII